MEGVSSYDVPIPGLNTQDLRDSSREVAGQVDRILEEEAVDQVNLLGVSMGGLIGLHYLRKRNGDKRVNQFVSLAAPLHGTTTVPLPGLLSTVLGKAPRQMHPESDFIQELHETASLDSDLLTLTVEGDPVVSPESARLDEARNVVSSHGSGKLAHWMAVVHPKNYRIYMEALLQNE
jgi:pimeloyl-ACP methyl ester carboxylesterase